MHYAKAAIGHQPWAIVNILCLLFFIQFLGKRIAGGEQALDGAVDDGLNVDIVELLLIA